MRIGERKRRPLRRGDWDNVNVQRRVRGALGPNTSPRLDATVLQLQAELRAMQLASQQAQERALRLVLRLSQVGPVATVTLYAEVPAWSTPVCTPCSLPHAAAGGVVTHRSLQGMLADPRTRPSGDA